MNTFSSRSHSIFTFYMLGPKDPPGTVPVKLVFVDLAGSERNDRTKSEGTALQEAKKINASLLALEKVILGFERSYEGNSFHIPFRESKLTMLLKDLFIGEALFAIVCNISPEKTDLPETLNALLFCSRCKNLKIKIRAAQKPRVTIQTDDSPLSRALDEENQLLRAKIRKLENELANEQAEKEELRKELFRVKASSLGEIQLTEEVLEEYKRKVRMCLTQALGFYKGEVPSLDISSLAEAHLYLAFMRKLKDIKTTKSAHMLETISHQSKGYGSPRGMGEEASR